MGRSGVVGFSWGGGECFRFATNRRDLSAAFVFYGTGPEPESIAKIQAPVYGFYAGADARVNETVPATTQQMKAAGKFYETVYTRAQPTGSCGPESSPTQPKPTKRRAPPRG